MEQLENKQACSFGGLHVFQDPMKFAVLYNTKQHILQFSSKRLVDIEIVVKVWVKL